MENSHGGIEPAIYKKINVIFRGNPIIGNWRTGDDREVSRSRRDVTGLAGRFGRRVAGA